MSIPFTPLINANIAFLIFLGLFSNPQLLASELTEGALIREHISEPIVEEEEGLAERVFNVPIMESAWAICDARVRGGLSKREDCEKLKNSSGGKKGDPHLKTFDGVAYDFQAVGEFTTVKSLLGGLEVQTRQGAWKDSTRASINTAVAVNVHQDKVVIFAGKDGLYINDLLETITTNKTLSNGGVVNSNSGGYLITWTDGSSLQVSKRGGSTPYLDLELSLSDSHKGQIQGLLGNFDGDTANEFTTRQDEVISDVDFDSLYDVFGESWRITQAESLFVYFDDETTETFTNRLFPYASVSVDELPADQRAWAEGICKGRGIANSLLLQNCILDVALTGDEAFADSFTGTDSPVAEEVIVSGSRDELFIHVSTEHSIPNGDFSLINDFGVSFTGRQADFSDHSTHESKWLFGSGRNKTGILATHPRTTENPAIYTIRTSGKEFIQYEFLSRKSPRVDFLVDGQVIHSIANSLALMEWHTGKFAVPSGTESVEMYHYYREIAPSDWRRDFVYWDTLEPSN